MQIRTMTPADYQAVYGVWLASKGMGLNDIDDTQEGIARFLKRNPETCFVAQEADAVIGVILCGNDGRRGYIYHTAVHPAHRKRGIASALVEAALQALRNLGIAKVALVVFKRNAPGNAFWESCNFTVRDDLVYRNLALTDIVRHDT